MKFRRAEMKDAGMLAEFMLLAMKDIVYKFIGKEDDKEALRFMTHFTAQENNQYSFNNCWVVELSGDPVAVANVYNGADLISLRQPVLNYIAANYTELSSLEEETTAGEYYLDTIAVSPKAQGKGVGSKLLQSLISHFVAEKQAVLGLLVDDDNPNARKLYEKMGFQFVQAKKLVGKSLAHLQYHPDYLVKL
ncbi:GNAT family N-acetyltransferase [Gynurincola endophyticus]|uniref:GNAT family N-acetyltransferase n=1 Tax=Gynurincola endophyticus TaxID=2479004 RepID=UPI000F8D58D8|nr:GNAT family N-acetyltransferase [Gynurincola endophyticus]